MSRKETISCTRRLHFCAGHRVMGHENKCATPHGHNYFVYLTAQAEALDSIGRVIDFSVLKDTVGGWIDTHWDHTFLVYEKDVEVLRLLQQMPGSKQPFVCPFNPTAENIASYLLKRVCPDLLAGSGVTVTRVRIDETENCFAEARLD
ncbi:MAG: 6-carboxytetrahydropterin synthase [Chlamydiia bacterium]|nr:6-carboxytetrahydropterin synthase [Chlamydiia bacterium]